MTLDAVLQRRTSHEIALGRAVRLAFLVHDEAHDVRFGRREAQGFGRGRRRVLKAPLPGDVPALPVAGHLQGQARPVRSGREISPDAWDPAGVYPHAGNDQK